MTKSAAQNDADVIRNACAQFTTAANAGDADLWASVYAPEGVLLPPNHPPVEGRAAIRDYMAQEFFGVFDVQMEDRTVELVVDGNMAFRRGSGTLTLTPKNGDPAIDDHMSYLEVWLRQSDGSWKLSQDAFNSNQPAG